MFRFLFLLNVSLSLLACSPASEPDPGGVWSPVVAADLSKPIKRHEAAFVKVADKFVLLGGRDIRPVSIYDPAIESWSEGAAPPVEIHHFQPVVMEEQVLIMGAFNGGYPDETPLPVIYQYDLANDRWSEGDSLPADRRRGAAGVVVYQDKLYLVAGIQRGHMSGHVPWLDEYDPATGTWTRLPDAPRARDHFQAIVMKDQLYVLGGRRSMAPDAPFGQPIGEVDVYDFATQTWRTLSEPLPTLRAGNFVTSMGEEILVLGGRNGAPGTRPQRSRSAPRANRTMAQPEPDARRSPRHRGGLASGPSLCSLWLRQAWRQSRIGDDGSVHALLEMSDRVADRGPIAPKMGLPDERKVFSDNAVL